MNRDRVFLMHMIDEIRFLRSCSLGLDLEGLPVPEDMTGKVLF